MFLNPVSSLQLVWSPTLNRGPEAHSVGCWLSTASYLQLVWSPTLNRGPEAHSVGCWLSLPHLIYNSSDLQLLSWGPEGPPTGCWLSLQHLVTNWSGLQTNWLPVSTESYNNSTPNFFLWASQLHSFNPSTVKFIILIFLDRMHLLFT